MGLPRYGFDHSSTAAAYLGPGPGKKTSARLAYGPGPAGSFDSFCGAGLAYTLPPLHVYKESATFFTISPCRTKPDPYRPPRFQPVPHWADRLSMTPGMAAQYKKDGSTPWKGNPVLQRPSSAAALLERLPKSSTAESLLRGVPPESKIGLGCCGVYVMPPKGKQRAPARIKATSGSSSSGKLVGVKPSADSPDGVMTAKFGKS